MKIGKPDECWEWLGPLNYSGYGTFNLKRKSGLRAHRVAWVMSSGSVPEGMCALHRCDVRPCCNHAHLFVGTHAENMRDMMVKGRHRTTRGEDNPKSKLSTDIVLAIREHYAQGEVTQRQLARQFSVTQTAIYYILHRVSWKHI